MMNNLFSSFDPSTNFNLSLNWLSTLIGLMLIPYLFWVIPSRMMILVMKINDLIFKEFKILIKPKDTNNLIIIISLFLLILFNNFIGLFPYIFTSTSHMILTLSMALPLWISFMIYGWLNHTILMLGHLVPMGTPGILMPFMVCIETISNIIRPGTLAIRLSANMIAGHLLLTLLGNTGPTMLNSLILILIFVQIMLLMLESAVAIIQSYVFTILATLYSSETS